MPYQDKWEKTGLHREFIGKVSGQEIIEANLNIQADSRFENIQYVLNNFTQTTEFEMSDFDVSQIVATDDAAAVTNPNLKIAIVTTNESLLSWIYQYLEKMEASPYQCQIFDNAEDALNWAST